MTRADEVPDGTSGTHASGDSEPAGAGAPVGRAGAGPVGTGGGPEDPDTDLEQTSTDLEQTSTELAETVAALSADDLEPAQRRRLLVRLLGEARARGLSDLFKPRGGLRWVTETITDAAPRIPIRDLDTLRLHYDGLNDEALAERLIRNASRATAGVGAAGGGVAAIEWAVTPTLLTAPVLLSVETVAVVGIEIKLIGELHQIYRVPVPAGLVPRGTALVQSWAQQRGVNPMLPGAGMAAVLGTAVRKELRDRLLRRFGRNLTTFGPLLTGAAVAAYLNRQATRALGERVREDLRRGQLSPARRVRP